MRLMILLFMLFSCHPPSLKLNETKEVYQKGANKDAVWAYIGFVPRVKNSEQVAITISKKGFTLRAHAIFSHAEIQQYARFLVAKIDDMEQLRLGKTFIDWSDGKYTVPFSVMEPTRYGEMLAAKTFIEPVIGQGYEANLKLLRSFFPDNVYDDGSKVHLNLVYPITTGHGAISGFGWLRQNPKEGIYTTQQFDERRTFYSKEPSAFVFGGFPALWFNGGIGIHGPIRYADDEPYISGTYGKIPIDGKKVDKRWQLVRKPNSHNCIRMEHLLELRSLMPRQMTTSFAQPEMQQVKIYVTNSYDLLNIMGQSKTVGVKYYWEDPKTPPSESQWKKTYYLQGNPNNLFEFELRDTLTVQLQVKNGQRTNSESAGLNPNATAAVVNRVPLNMNL